ncbi:MAG: DUF211 domain-containing protein [Thermoplasmataceae archaeon]|jgi:hypothetical protein
MNIRRIVLDVAKGLNKPTLVEVADAIGKVKGVEAVNLSVNEMDMETMGIIITVEGDGIDSSLLLTTIEEIGCAVHSIDEVAAGKRLINSVIREAS